MVPLVHSVQKTQAIDWQLGGFRLMGKLSKDLAVKTLIQGSHGHIENKCPLVLYDWNP